MVQELALVVLTGQPLRSAAGASLLTEALDKGGLLPTRWGLADRPNLDWDPGAVHAALTNPHRVVDTLALKRARAPRWQGWLLFHPLRTTDVFIEVPAPADLPRWFAWAEALVCALRAEYAFLHTRLEEGPEDIVQDYNGPTAVPGREIFKLGLPTVTARTWYGPALSAHIGGDQLARCGTTQTVGSLVRVDLAPDPWTLDLPTIYPLVQKARSVLAEAGVLGTDLGGVRPERAPRWLSLPRHAEVTT